MTPFSIIKESIYIKNNNQTISLIERYEDYLLDCDFNIVQNFFINILSEINLINSELFNNIIEHSFFKKNIPITIVAKRKIFADSLSANFKIDYYENKRQILNISFDNFDYDLIYRLFISGNNELIKFYIPQLKISNEAANTLLIYYIEFNFNNFSLPRNDIIFELLDNRTLDFYFEFNTTLYLVQNNLLHILQKYKKFIIKNDIQYEKIFNTALINEYYDIIDFIIFELHYFINDPDLFIFLKKEHPTVFFKIQQFKLNTSLNQKLVYNDTTDNDEKKGKI